MSLVVTIRKNQDELPTSIMLDPLPIKPTDPSFFKYVILESVNFDLPNRLCRVVLTGGTSKEISLSDNQVWQLKNTDNTNSDLLNRLQSIVYSALVSPENRQICENALLEVYKIKDIPIEKYKLFKACELLNELQLADYKLSSEINPILSSTSITNLKEIKNTLKDMQAANRCYWNACYLYKKEKKPLTELIKKEKILLRKKYSLEDTPKENLDLENLDEKLKELATQIEVTKKEKGKEIEKLRQNKNEAQREIESLFKENRRTRTIGSRKYTRCDYWYHTFYKIGYTLIDELNQDPDTIKLFIESLSGNKKQELFISFLWDINLPNIQVPSTEQFLLDEKVALEKAEVLPH